MRKLHPLQLATKSIIRNLGATGKRLSRRSFILIHEAQHDPYTARRKEIWEALYPSEPSRDYSLESYDGEEMGEPSCTTHPETDAMGRKKSPQQAKGFAAATAELTGESNPSDSSESCESVSASL